MLIRTTIFALALASLVSGAATLATAAPTGSDAVVKAKAVAGKPGGGGLQVIEVELTMDDGWHLYANPVGNKDLLPNQVVVSASANKKPIDAKVEYPKGKLFKDATLGDYYIYEDKVTIKVTVDRSALGSAPVDLKVAVQACNSTTCKTPADIKLSVP
jgi:DsbC/DsbD-like thiol-disulfide interchange protein